MKEDSKEYEEIIKSRSDSFLKYLGESAENAMLDDYSEKEIHNLTVRPETEARILAMAEMFYCKKQQKERAERYRKFERVAAVIAIILTLSFTTAVISVDALRVRVFEFLFDNNEEYTEVTPVETSIDSKEIKEILPEDWENVFYPDYLPESYKFKEAVSTGEIKIIYFENNKEDMIIFSQEIWNDNEILLDNKAAKFGEILINGNRAFWTIKNNETSLIWIDNQYLFIISGPNNLETLSKIAENLILIK